MILWTIQKQEVWEQLKERGYITGGIDYVDQSWIPEYRWMVEQMIERIGNPPCKNFFPIWAWYQWESSKRNKPDLRSGGHLTKKEKGVRIEFNCHENEALLSDFELWHYVLNYWYLPDSITDGENFNAELKKKGLSFYKTKPLPHPIYHEKIMRSWIKIFELDWNEPDLTCQKNEKSIQATVWQLKIDQVRSYKYFKSR